MPAAYAEESDPVFKTAAEGTQYAGMPLFDGEPDHLDAYLDTLFEYVGVEGMMRWAPWLPRRLHPALGDHAGATIPGAELFETTQGVST